MADVQRFTGHIAGLGTTSGTRLVVGAWNSGPLGAFTDVMVEDPAGHRTLLAPRGEVARFVAGTYTFDAIRVVDVEITRADDWTITAGPLRLTFTPGRRLALAHLLRAVPPALAGSPGWARACDPVARRIMPGVRTHGTSSNGRTEWYAARDVRRLDAATASWAGDDLGALAPVDPPVRFGFGSAPRRPTLTTLSSYVRTR